MAVGPVTVVVVASAAVVVVALVVDAKVTSVVVEGPVEPEVHAASVRTRTMALTHIP